MKKRLPTDATITQNRKTQIPSPLARCPLPAARFRHEFHSRLKNEKDCQRSGVGDTRDPVGVVQRSAQAYKESTLHITKLRKP